MDLRYTSIAIDSNDNVHISYYDATNYDLKYATNAPTYTITATVGLGGSILPSGDVTVDAGSDQTFTITPERGYKVSDVLVDGVSIAQVISYTFTNVSSDHTIHAEFTKRVMRRGRR